MIGGIIDLYFYYQGIWKSTEPGKACKVGGLIMAGKSVQMPLLKND